MKMNNYKVEGHIGEGAHGYVMRGIDIRDNKEVALKKLVVKCNDGISMGVVREINSLQEVDCDNIVQLYDVIPQGMGFILVMEYVPLSLWELIRDIRYTLTEPIIKCYAKMLLNGVAHMHSKNLMHRDLKPANLLITNEGVLKIADFGLARIYSKNEPERQYSHQVATRWYRAPELLYGSRDYTPSIDMWAVGCIIVELYNRNPLFPGETDIEQLAIVLQKLGTPTDEIWPEMKLLPDYNKITFPQFRGLAWDELLVGAKDCFVEFIKRFLLYNHKLRITAKDAQKDEYFWCKPLPSRLEDMPKPLPILNWEIDTKLKLTKLQELINC